MKAILFDLDGTLTDSGEGIMKCAVHALAHYGIEAPSEEQLRTIVGPPLSESFARLGVANDKIEEAIEIYRSRYIPIGIYENTPYAGVDKLLEQLKADGHKLYVATSKPEWMAVKVLEHFDLAKHFDIICGAATDFSRNTKGAVIAYLLEQCGQQDHAVMVGDTVYDVLGAKEHNVPCIGVAWGYGIVSDMEQAGASAVAHTMDELYQLLK